MGQVADVVSAVRRTTVTAMHNLSSRIIPIISNIKTTIHNTTHNNAQRMVAGVDTTEGAMETMAIIHSVFQIFSVLICMLERRNKLFELYVGDKP